MNRKKKVIIITATVIILVSNMPFVNSILLHTLDKGKIRYSNGEGSFTYIDRFEFLSGMFTNNDKTTEEIGEIYRLYRINPLYFWRWSFYLLVSKDFRYKNWEKEIEPNRVPYDPENFRWQKF